MRRWRLYCLGCAWALGAVACGQGALQRADGPLRAPLMDGSSGSSGSSGGSGSSSSTTPSGPTNPNCQVLFETQTPWSEPDLSFETVANLQIVNLGSDDIAAPWTFAFSSDALIDVLESWNWQAQVSNGVASGAVPDARDVLKKNSGTTVLLGALIKVNRDTNLVPDSATVNDLPCAVTQ